MFKKIISVNKCNILFYFIFHLQVVFKTSVNLPPIDNLKVVAHTLT